MAAFLTILASGCQPIAVPTPVANSPAEQVAFSVPRDMPSPAEGPPTASQNAEPVADELIADGRSVYLALYCGVCHVSDAAETRGTFGPTHNGMGATAAQRLNDPAYTGTAQTPAEYIIESLIDPEIYLVPGYAISSHRMPVYTHLAESEIIALTAFLLAQ